MRFPFFGWDYGDKRFIFGEYYQIRKKLGNFVKKFTV